MLKDQAKSIHKLESIQIDLTFKRVKGNINEFEINSYNSKHKLSKLFDIYFHFYILQYLISDIIYLFIYSSFLCSCLYKCYYSRRIPAPFYRSI
jgi:hypothetical protein